jgi:hypothetical protein
MAEPDYLTYPGTDVQIKVLGTKTRSEDPETLCASEHSVVIGLTPPPTTDNPAKPYETSIVVAFTAIDTSGAGYIGQILDPMAVAGGIKVFVTDPQKYSNTIEAGKAGAYQKIATGTTGEKIEGGAFIAIANTPPVKAYQALAKGWKKLFGAESPRLFRATDYFGQQYHYEDASAHKIRIQIFNTPPDGTRRQVYNSELAGSSDDSKGYVLPAFGYFAIDSPGKWEVYTESIASGTCGTPKLKFSKSFTVPVPQQMVDTDGDGVADSLVSTQSGVATRAGGSDSDPTVGLETIIGGTLLTGVFLYALLAPRRE